MKLRDDAQITPKAVECGNLFQPSLKRLVAPSLAHTGAVATALCVTSPASHGRNKFQHSTALRAPSLSGHAMPNEITL